MIDPSCHVVLRTFLQGRQEVVLALQQRPPTSVRHVRRCAPSPYPNPEPLVIWRSNTEELPDHSKPETEIGEVFFDVSRD